MRTGFIAAAILIFVTWAAAPAVHAEQFDAAGITVSLELPPGYCALSRTHAVEKLYYEQQDRMQKGINRALLLGVPCKNVKALRGGAAPEIYVMWLMNSPQDVPAIAPASMTRQQILDELARMFPKLDPAMLNSHIKDRASKEGAKLNLQGNFGVTGQDTDAVYIQQVVKAQGAGKEESIAVAGAVTTISRRLFSLNAYKLHEGPQTFNELLVPLKAAIVRTMEANTNK
jgi:hypothetical protein